MYSIILLFSVLAVIPISLSSFQRYPVRRFNQPNVRRLPPHIQRIKATSSSVPVRTTTVQSLPYNFKNLENITSIRQLLMETAISPMKSVGPVARITQNINTAQLPCCRDRFGEQACQSLRKAQPALFEKRCLTDHDFSSIDCCGECRKYIERNKISSENSRSLQKAPAMCKDKHSIGFCRRFKASGMGKYSCSDAEFAVRVCRHSCGYCNDELYSMKNAPSMCSDTNKAIPIVNGTHLYWAFGREDTKKAL
ncbi:hypothetical protein L3Y34_008208 [Caenorhabditis briggsae]|nr:hypothetical protein L3Y34_008208 [Caenorhabditis briggsae]